MRAKNGGVFDGQIAGGRGGPHNVVLRLGQAVSGGLRRPDKTLGNNLPWYLTSTQGGCSLLPMTTTPTTHRGIWVESVYLPQDLVATDSVISWARAGRSGLVRLRGGEWTDADLAGTDTLLSDFIALASADPEQMAAFMARYGILELCGEHGRPDGHDHGYFCPLLDVDDGHRQGVEVRTVRRAARAFADLRQWGQAVRVGLKPSAVSGQDSQLLMPSSGFRSGRKGSRD